MLHPINYDSIAQEIKKPEHAPSSEQQDAFIHKEAIKQYLQQQTQQHAQQNPMPANTTPQHTATEDEFPAYADTASTATKSTVDKLIHITFGKGLREGIAHAAKMDPFIMDMYHDALAEKLFIEMKSRKLI